MWAFLGVFVLVLAAIIGGVLAGGVFTIVLVPLAAIALASGVAYAMWGRAAEGSAGQPTNASHEPDRPLPPRTPRDSGRAPTSPERLADARRAQQ